MMSTASSVVVSIVVLCFVACVSSSPAHSPLTDAEYRAHFINFTRIHGKQYTLSQMFDKFEKFKANLDDVTAHNSLPNVTWTKAINHLSDLSADEFKQLKGFKQPTDLTMSVSTPNVLQPIRTPILSPIYTPIPIHLITGVWLDWRTHSPSPVTAVKDQGQCGSCWAFSTTGVVEGAYALKHNVAAVPLSESDLVDCDTSGQSGCGGGYVYKALGFIESNGGICTESAYPYHVSQQSCGASHCTKTASALTAVNQVYNAYQFTFPQTSSNVHVSTPSEQDIINHLAVGPVGVAVEADQAAWQSYHGGILTAATTCGHNLDHAVLIVGYGTDLITNTDYWIIKNSWGTSWGESGYIRMQRGVGLCGVGLNYFWATAA